MNYPPRGSPTDYHIDLPLNGVLKFSVGLSPSSDITTEVSSMDKLLELLLKVEAILDVMVVVSVEMTVLCLISSTEG